MEAKKKISCKILSTDDIRKQARNWTLAGDVGLLAHLEQLSEDILYKTQKTQSQLCNLAENVEEAHTKFGNVTNQFLSLQNSQFVENRVYDEETPVEEKIQDKVINEAEKEKLLLIQYKEAVESGIELLDTHFQEIELPPNSDSDEDEISTGNVSLIWKPNNPYRDKKFPLLIGSAEWWADDNAGLGSIDDTFELKRDLSDSESEIEFTGDMEKRLELSSSASSMENVKPVSTKPAELQSSSEDFFGLLKNDSVKPKSENFFGNHQNSILGEDKVLFPPLKKEIEVDFNRMPNDDEKNKNEKTLLADETEEAAGKSFRKVDSAFANELADKLASVAKANSHSHIAEEAKSKSSYKDYLFDDNEDSSDLFSSEFKNRNLPIKSKHCLFDSENTDKLFSDSEDLFNESESNVYGENNSIKFDNEETETKATQPKESALFKESASDLFGDLDDDDTLFDDALFSQKSSSKKQSDLINQPNEKIEDTNTNLFDNEFLDDSPKKYAVSNEKKVLENNSKTSTMVKVDEKKLDSLNESLASIFDEKEDLFSDILNEEPTIGEKSSRNNISALENDDVSLFLEKTKLTGDTSISSSRSSLFEDVNFSKSRLASVFEKDRATKFEDDLFGASDDSLFRDNSFPKKTEKDHLFASETHKKLLCNDNYSLFDDKDDIDELFANTKEKKNLFRETSVLLNLPSGVTERENTIMNSHSTVKEIKKYDDKKFNSNSENILFDKSNNCDDNSLFGKDSIDFKKMEEADTKTNFVDSEKLNPKVPSADVLDIAKIHKIKDEILKESSQALPKNDPLTETDNLFGETSESSTKPLLENSSKKVDDLFAEDFLKISKISSKKKYILEDSEDLFSKNEKSSSIHKSVPSSQHEKSNQGFLLSKDEDSKALSQINVNQKLIDEVDKPFREVIFSPSCDSEEKNSLGILDQQCSGGETVTRTTKPTPPSSLMLKKDAVFNGESKNKNIGKLKIPENLKSTLESVVKSASSVGPPKEDTKKNELPQADNVDTKFEPISNLLKCPSKDRVKIPIKRRPQSRRARQLAIRNSGQNFFVDNESDFLVACDNENFSIINGNEANKKDLEVGKVPSEPLFSTISSNPLSPSTDEEDYFNVSELDSNFEKEDQNIYKSNLFQSTGGPKLEKTLLFDGVPILSSYNSEENPNLFKNEKEEKKDDEFFSGETPLVIKSKNKSIFENDEISDFEDDDEGLFKAGTSAKKFEKSGLFQKRTTKSLFDVDEGEGDGDDDDDDLFGAKICSSVIVKKPSEKTSKSNDKESKLNDEEKTKELFADPLGLISTGNQ